MRIEVAPQIRTLLDQRRIEIDEIRKVIESAEDAKNLFINRVTGHFLASFSIGAVTYWVEYVLEDDLVKIHSAYTHRIKVMEVLTLPPGSGMPETDWSCSRCDKPLEWAPVKLEYLNQTFETHGHACLSCRRALVSEELAVGKMAMVETLLEDK